MLNQEPNQEHTIRATGRRGDPASPTAARQAGYTMAEVLVATALSGVILAGAVYMFGQSVDISTIATLRGDMQQNARVAINLIFRDLLVAGTGLPAGGVQLPYGAGILTPQLGCDQASGCWVNPGGTGLNTSTTPLNFTQTVNGATTSWMYWINPQDGQGPQIAQPNTPLGSSVDHDPWPATSGAIVTVPTDVITIVYKDNNYPVNWNPSGGACGGSGTCASGGPLNQFAVTSISITGSPTTVTFDPGTNPSPYDAAYGLNAGDVLFFNNSNGTAVATVTNAPTNNTITLGTTGDSLNFNTVMYPSGGTPALGIGGLSSIQNMVAGVPQGTFPATTAFRLIVVTYFIDNYTYAYPRLMRQVNGLTPTPVAQNIENLQFSYDIFDTVSNTICPNVANPYLPPSSCSTTTQYSPNQISKVNIFVQARSASQRLVNRGYSRISMISAVTPRNLDFIDKY